MRKTIQQVQQRSSVQKTARKSTKYWKNETLLKITNLAKAIAHAKAISTKYWRNETNLKNGHLAKARAHAKAIAFAKCSVSVKN